MVVTVNTSTNFFLARIIQFQNLNENRYINKHNCNLTNICYAQTVIISEIQMENTQVYDSNKSLNNNNSNCFFFVFLPITVI